MADTSKKDRDPCAKKLPEITAAGQCNYLYKQSPERLQWIREYVDYYSMRPGCSPFLKSACCPQYFKNCSPACPIPNKVYHVPCSPVVNAGIMPGITAAGKCDYFYRITPERLQCCRKGVEYYSMRPGMSPLPYCHRECIIALPNQY